ncbi:transcriptional regulator [Halogeometricum borinquense DSM 11551]|uniref:HTH-type transcriptional regulator n=2 Tax=Halogeometricum borinquense TaxID=60847 RepID=E4NWQ9_HALBP|nr:MarR family transcriptional regulator [Halogeometricum borinquense]ADQ69479.1 predicted transcriptional regulator [Halogeometricum borinquense DSM 11551]ELY26191.1 transcriptional regulator [Halogeometricum borinquense DSM 11551]RYJ19514.1 transcriptional regulator [Halogeometricum borinquense]
MTEEAYDEARTEIADAMARTAELYGLNRSYGRVYGFLYFAGGPKSLDELAEETGYAKSTVSNAMGTLERYHLVHRRSAPGEGRKVYFEAETDFWTVLTELFEREGRREIRIMRRALENAQETLEEAPETEETKRAEERIEQLQQLYRQSERVLEFFTEVPIDELLAYISEFRNRDTATRDD